MSIFEQLQRLQQMQKLIAAEQTGPPIDFARKLNISTRLVIIFHCLFYAANTAFFAKFS